MRSSGKGARLPVAKDWTKELIAAGFDERLLKDLLAAFGTASNQRKPPLVGMRSRALRSLAQRMCRIASEIKTLNGLLSPGFGQPAPEVQGAGLSFELVLYAAWLVFLSRMPLEYRASDRQMIELLLIAAARRFTHKPQYTALSHLLTEKDASGDGVSPEALLQLARDHETQIRYLEGQLEALPSILLQRRVD